MKILKYFFLLILLILVGSFVFISTQTNEFKVEKKTFLKFNKETVYNYLNDFKNWNEWNYWNQNNKIVNIVYSDTTIDANSYYKWSDGLVRSIFSKQSDSLAQKVQVGNYKSLSQIKLKDTIGGTILTWKVAGTVGFKDKFLNFLSGGNNTNFTSILTKNLNQLNAVLNLELNTFDVKIDPIIQIPNQYFVYQQRNISKENLSKAINQSIITLNRFVKNSATKTTGSPFIKYNLISNNVYNINVSIPIQDEIFITEHSDVLVGNTEAYSALKVILTGDLSHRQKAIKSANEYLIKNKIAVDTEKSIVDIYKESSFTGKSPSQWKTEILIPVINTVYVAPKVANDSITLAP